MSGAAVHPSDVVLPDMLYGGILRRPHPHAIVKVRRPHPHAIVKGVDTSQARAIAVVDRW